MPDFRAFGHPANSLCREILLSKEESHHLVVVNRASSGASVVVFDGQGQEWVTRLDQAAKQAAVLTILNHRPAPPRPFRLTLAQALPKGAGMEEIVQKATEIGAARIIPLLTERTLVHLEGTREDRKVEKWRTTALEAAKQCGNPWLPEIAAPLPWATFLAQTDPTHLLTVASLHPTTLDLGQAWRGYRAHHGHWPVEATIVIGPEGDLSREEVEAAVAKGFQPVTLGPLVLRCGTAATYAVAVLSHEALSAQQPA